MPAAPRNQTISYLKARFAEVGIEPEKRYGQNFLTDINLLHLLFEAAEIGPDDVVLEIGTGTGALTGLLATRAAAVVSVEVDARMHQLAYEELIDFDNVTLLQQDALRNKNNFSPTVLEAIDAQLAVSPTRQFKLAANLPYCVATPIISNLLMLERPPVTMTVTIQKELADRIVAPPGNKDYGALSVWIQSQCSAEIVRVMPPSVFWPRPKVDSAIVKIVLQPERRAAIPDLDFFHTFARSVFFHRRKFLRSVLISAFKNQLDKPQVDEALAEQQLDETLRAEQLSVEQLLALSEALRRKLPATAE